MVRPGGRIGLANWTPDGFIGRLFEVMRALRAAAARASARRWSGASRRGSSSSSARSATDIRTERRTYTFRYRSAEHWIDFFRTYYGPTHKAFAALDEEGGQALHAALLELLARSHRGNGGGLCVPGEYLEVVVTR